MYSNIYSDTNIIEVPLYSIQAMICADILYRHELYYLEKIMTS